MVLLRTDGLPSCRTQCYHGPATGRRDRDDVSRGVTVELIDRPWHGGMAVVLRARSHCSRLLAMLLSSGVLVTLLNPTGAGATELPSSLTTPAAAPGQGP